MEIAELKQVLSLGPTHLSYQHGRGDTPRSHDSNQSVDPIRHLDEQLDRLRQKNPLSPDALDLVMMSYRYWAPYEKFLMGFLKKKLKPPYLRDLLLLSYTLALTRNWPLTRVRSVMMKLTEAVFGNPAKPIVSAFMGRLEKDIEREKLQLSQRPELFLSPELGQRWPLDLQQVAGRMISQRPEPGISGFRNELQWNRWPASQFLNEPSGLYQAMDLGSWRFCEFFSDSIEQWLNSRAKMSELRAPIRYLDTCSAPGGKTIYIAKRFPSFQIFASDLKFPRLQRLRSNLKRWKLDEAVRSTLIDWSQSPVVTPNDWPQRYDVILLDLPCSATGTISTQPDVQIQRLSEKIDRLARLQESIIENAKNHLASNGLLCVSICSVDPQEIQQVSQSVATEPQWSSWSTLSPRSHHLSQNCGTNCEGITAWIYSRNE